MSLLFDPPGIRINYAKELDGTVNTVTNAMISRLSLENYNWSICWQIGLIIAEKAERIITVKVVQHPIA